MGSSRDWESTASATKKAEGDKRVCLSCYAAKEVTQMERAGQGGSRCRELTQHFCSHPCSVSSLRQRVGTLQRDRHTQWDSTTLHCITPGAGEVSKARRRNKPGGAEEPMFPSGKVGRRRCKASNAFMNVTMMKTHDRMEKDHFGPLSLGQKSPLESVENFDRR